MRLSPETAGQIEVCGKAIGRHRAIDAVSRQIEKLNLDSHFPIIPLYTYNRDNCDALIRKLSAAGHAVDERMLTVLGPTLAAHIGPGAYGAAFVAEA